MIGEQAFPTETIVLTHAAALRARAIVETRAITTWGIVYIKDANAIRYNPETGTGEVFVAGNWIQMLPTGIASWAAQEGLTWRMDDGRVLHPDEPLYPNEPLYPTDGLRPPVLPDMEF